MQSLSSIIISIRMIKVRHLTQRHYRQMPWKSHRGITSEIFIYPEDGALQSDSYLWRVSSASVSSSCPFSQFLGFDRTIVLLDQATMALNHDCMEVPQIVRRMTPYQFKGEWETTCEISDHAVIDFNLVVRRGKVASVLKTLELGRVPVGFKLNYNHTLIFCVTGELKVLGNHFYETLFPYETLLIEKIKPDSAGSDQIEISSLLERSELILVQVSPKE